MIVLLTSSCTEFALISSSAGIAVSQNAYAKAYSGLDFLTIINTQKDIKMHAYDAFKKEAAAPVAAPPVNHGCSKR